MTFLLKKWRDLSVAKKLYGVVGLMALLVATELFTLFFAMSTLSSLRALVMGESLWSKAQKDAILNLQQYSFNGDEAYFRRFKDFLTVPLGDRQARLNLIGERPNYQRTRDGFLKGGIHKDDVDGIIKLLSRFDNDPYVKRAIKAWTSADEIMSDLVTSADRLHNAMITQGIQSREVGKIRDEIAETNIALTHLENEFSVALSEASRWLEKVLMMLLTITVFTVEGTGLFLTFRFSRSLSRSLNNLRDVAQEVGGGNLSARAEVQSEDELGQLARALNKMVIDLEASIGVRKVAEDANRIKSIFLANTSHEIRTPLGIILGFVEVLRDSSLSLADRDKYLDIVEHTGRNLGRIIDDIIDISRIESGHLELKVSHFDLSKFIEELKEMFAVDMAKRKNQFVVTGDKKIRTIGTDKERLQQVLVNLIGNANKFTENGTIELNYGRRNGRVFFKLSDNGIGIGEGDRDRLFQIFTQADQTTKRRYGGTGLGLVLSKKIARALGGDVWLESSRPREGSVFMVEVQDRAGDLDSISRIGWAPNSLEASNHSELFPGRTVLVVDDSQDNILLLNLLIPKLGPQVLSARDGFEALELVKSGRNVDIIIMDIQMPGMDGFQCTAEMRKVGFTGPIIALTANAFREAREKSLNAGCDEFLTKPLSLEKMAGAFRRLLA